MQVIIGLDNMLAAYMNEYGEELVEALTAGEEDETIVEAEIIEDDDDEQETSETGFDSEDAGVDTPPQEEE